MTEDIKRLIQSINEEISTQQYGQSPKELYDPIHYIMDLGGKRMRPLLTVLAYQLFKDNPAAAIPPSLAVEIFHNFTLMHDDIMDDAPLRRGEKTVHEKWSEPIAILSGDVMLVKAYEHLIKHCPQEQLTEILKKFNQCATEVCEGQQHDMNFEDKEQVSEGAYLDMIRQKTAVLLGFALEFGGILAETSEQNCQALYDLGVNIGIGFQLKDDLLDVYADQSKFGKQVGGDIIANKKTFLLIKALETAEGTEKESLEYWLKQQMFDKEEKVNAIMDVYSKLDIKAMTEYKMKEYFTKGFQALEALDVDSSKKQGLTEFMDYLINREK